MDPWRRRGAGVGELLQLLDRVPGCATISVRNIPATRTKLTLLMLLKRSAGAACQDGRSITASGAGWHLYDVERLVVQQLVPAQLRAPPALRLGRLLHEAVKVVLHEGLEEQRADLHPRLAGQRVHHGSEGGVGRLASRVCVGVCLGTGDIYQRTTR